MKNKLIRLVLFQVEVKEGIQWVVEYPEYPGIVGGGTSKEDALIDAEKNLNIYFNYCIEHNIDLPPTNVISHGTDDLSGRITLRMTKSMHHKVIDRAIVENVSINHLINEAISEYIYSSLGKITIDSESTANQSHIIADHSQPYHPKPNRKQNESN
jgi:predicted RNase H-like HicB family nuclease